MATTTYTASQGDTLDYVCWKLYGQQSGAVEAVLEANPGLADLGEVIPVGTKITMPDLAKPETEVQPIRLWG